MVTPEMLLFLVGKVLPANSAIVDGNVVYTLEEFRHMRSGHYAPHLDDAQFGRLVVWAAMQGLPIRFEDWCVEAFEDGYAYFDVSHNSTPDSIRAAAVVAICRALNYEGE